MNKISGLKNYIKKNYAQWVIVCFSLSMMGAAIAMLQLTGFGTDPLSSMTYGISYLSGLSFGVCQLMYNAVALVLIMFLDRKPVGFGTVANMVLVGFVADLFSGIFNGFLGGNPPTLIFRIGFFVVGLAIFVIFAGIYASCEQGLSPCDGLVYIAHVKLQKLFRRKINYRIVRIPYDSAYLLAGWLLGGETGLVTIAMVLFLGPVMDFIQQLKNKKKKRRCVLGVLNKPNV